ncbi:MAG: tetratricopeptide repeat protein [Rhodobacter sp.]|nr:tetratricopeptide repeat protein [Rhodobacter sp.]
MSQQTLAPDVLQVLVTLYTQGHYQELLDRARAQLGTYPRSHQLYNLVGAAEAGLGKTDAALAAYRNSIELKPDYAEAHSNLGATLHTLRRYSEAADACERAVAINPRHAQALGNLGSARIALGQFAEAQEALRQALAVVPDHPVLLNGLGVALRGMGRNTEALEALRKAAQSAHGNAGIHSNLGAVLLDLGQRDEAETACRTALGLAPDDPEVLTTLARVLAEGNRADEAEKHYRTALSRRPDYGPALTNLGALLIDRGRYRQAVETLQLALERQPENTTALTNLGQALYVLGDHAAATAATERAVSLAPDSAEAQANLGNLLSDLGRRDDAEACFRKALAAQPDNAIAHLGLSRMGQTAADDPRIPALEQAVASGRLPQGKRVAATFALAKIYDDLDRTSEAFAQYQTANALRRSQFDYDLDDDRRLFQRLKAEFADGVPPEGVATAGGAPVPIFILGMPRSGTTLVEQILASHSRVFGAGELNSLQAAVNSVSTGQPGAYADIGRRYRSDLVDLGVSDPFVTDKMPLNFRWIGHICAALPDARIFHIRRDPRAVCWSIYTQLFGGDGNRYGYDLAEVAGFWRLYSDLMDHWERIFPGAICHVDYEALTEDQEAETRRMLDFAGLGWEPGCLSFHETGRRVSTASSQQVRRKMYRGSSLNWRRFEQHLGPMLEVLGAR